MFETFSPETPQIILLTMKAKATGQKETKGKYYPFYTNTKLPYANTTNVVILYWPWTDQCRFFYNIDNDFWSLDLHAYQTPNTEMQDYLFIMFSSSVWPYSDAYRFSLTYFTFNEQVFS